MCYNVLSVLCFASEGEVLPFVVSLLHLSIFIQQISSERIFHTSVSVTKSPHGDNFAAVRTLRLLLVCDVCSLCTTPTCHLASTRGTAESLSVQVSTSFSFHSINMMLFIPLLRHSQLDLSSMLFFFYLAQPDKLHCEGESQNSWKGL